MQEKINISHINPLAVRLETVAKEARKQGYAFLDRLFD